jgi:hypothetical protein
MPSRVGRVVACDGGDVGDGGGAEVADHDEARSIVRRLVETVPSGSYLVISDGTDTSPKIVEDQRMPPGRPPYHLRSPAQIASYFDGLDLVEPGVVSIPHWRPEPGPLPPGHGRLLRRHPQALTPAAGRDDGRKIGVSGTDVKPACIAVPLRAILPGGGSP